MRFSSSVSASPTGDQTTVYLNTQQKFSVKMMSSRSSRRKPGASKKLDFGVVGGLWAGTECPRGKKIFIVRGLQGGRTRSRLPSGFFLRKLIFVNVNPPRASHATGDDTRAIGRSRSYTRRSGRVEHSHLFSTLRTDICRVKPLHYTFSLPPLESSLYCDSYRCLHDLVWGRGFSTRHCQIENRGSPFSRA